MIILGIDPGLLHTGWGIISITGNQLKYITNGTIHSSKDEILSYRLKEIYLGLEAVIEEFKPDACAVEETFVNANPRSALKLGQARGACLLAPSLKNIEVNEYSATVIKKAVVGTGRADKRQVKSMVEILLNCSGRIDSEDSADALAVAICHSHYHQYNNKVNV